MKTKIINELKSGESIVLFAKDYKVLMRTIGSYISRKQISDTIRYKKAQVIVADVLTIGVLVTNISE